MIEVIAGGRQPLEAPAHALPEGLNLCERRARDRDESHVALGEVNGRAIEMIRQQRAARAALLPAWSEHEVVDDQLAAPVEQVGERLLAGRALEDVSLLDLDPGQLASERAQPVALSGELLLLPQEPLARGDPVVAGYNRVIHGSASRG
jgi:hypothetical protein